MNMVAYNLLSAVTSLARILDQPVDGNGVISVRYQDASEAINAAQMAALKILDEFVID